MLQDIRLTISRAGLDDLIILHGLTGYFNDSTLTAIVGPSGSGKSSLFGTNQSTCSLRLLIKAQANQQLQMCSDIIYKTIPFGNNCVQLWPSSCYAFVVVRHDAWNCGLIFMYEGLVDVQYDSIVLQNK